MTNGELTETRYFEKTCLPRYLPLRRMRLALRSVSGNRGIPHPSLSGECVLRSLLLSQTNVASRSLSPRRMWRSLSLSLRRAWPSPSLSIRRRSLPRSSLAVERGSPVPVSQASAPPRILSLRVAWPPFPSLSQACVAPPFLFSLASVAPRLPCHSG